MAYSSRKLSARMLHPFSPLFGRTSTQPSSDAILTPSINSKSSSRPLSTRLRNTRPISLQLHFTSPCSFAISGSRAIISSSLPSRLSAHSLIAAASASNSSSCQSPRSIAVCSKPCPARGAFISSTLSVDISVHSSCGMSAATTSARWPERAAAIINTACTSSSFSRLSFAIAHIPLSPRPMQSPALSRVMSAGSFASSASSLKRTSIPARISTFATASKSGLSCAINTHASLSSFTAPWPILDLSEASYALDTPFSLCIMPRRLRVTLCLSPSRKPFTNFRLVSFVMPRPNPSISSILTIWRSPS